MAPRALPRPPAWRDWLALTKPRLNFLVIFSAVAGFLLGKRPGEWPVALWHFTGGTFLLAGGSAVLNMWLERDSDSLMLRTKDRPLAARRLDPAQAAAFGLGLTLAALLWLALATDWVTTALGAATWSSYLLAYTPLKRVTSLSVLVGAVPGALPPVMGWTASGQSLDHAALALFLILFFWQVPHFLAIAGLYQGDYLRAGIRMLASDYGPEVASRQAVAYTLALLPVTLWFRGLGLVGAPYEAAAIVLGLGFIAAAVYAGLRPGRKGYRGLLLASVTYLPLLFAAMLADKQATFHP